MELSRRGFIAAAGSAAAVPTIVSAQEAATAKPQAGQLSEDMLGNMLRAMGLKPEKIEKRYDFTFRSIQNREEWDLSMTSVLSEDQTAVWAMAWLDELPRSAAEVPRTALLRLLAANDRLGSGKFFAYVASNRRFVLQRVVPNAGMTTRGFRDLLKDLGRSVVDSYPYWSTANWSGSSQTATTASRGSADKGVQQAQPGLQGAGRTPTRTAAGGGRTDIK
ncbi:MAG: type III secretion system chaperone [Planctomycetaceae bacterium]